MKTLGVRETLRMVLSCMHASDRPTMDCSFSSDGEEISEIHWICGEDVPDPEVQSNAWLVRYTYTQSLSWYSTEQISFKG